MRLQEDSHLNLPERGHGTWVTLNGQRQLVFPENIYENGFCYYVLGSELIKYEQSKQATTIKQP